MEKKTRITQKNDDDCYRFGTKRTFYIKEKNKQTQEGKQTKKKCRNGKI